MALPWFRYHAHVLNHPRVQDLPPDLFKIWVNLMCIACLEDCGKDGKLPPIKTVSYHLRMKQDECFIAFHALVEAGLLVTVDETFHLRNWGKMQYKSDVSTERVKRFRKRSRNVSETAPDTDTDSDTESPLPPKGPRSKKFDYIKPDYHNFDIANYIDDPTREMLKTSCAPGWSMDWLENRYNEDVRNRNLELPQIPKSMFCAWVKGFCKNRKPE